MAKNNKRFGDERDNQDYRGSKSTMPARQRDGKTYPGGRSLRRAYARLRSAQSMHNGAGDHTTPGAMRP